MSIKPVKLNIGNKKRGEGPFEIFLFFFFYCLINLKIVACWFVLTRNK
jgi:hypothetical protein